MKSRRQAGLSVNNQKEKPEENGKMMMKYLLMIAGIFAGDQWIKEYVEENERLNVKRPVAGGRISITKHHNKGAALNFMEKKPDIILGTACITFGYVIILLRQIFSKEGNGLMKLSISLIAGGGLSNLYDRIKRGYVVDYFTINCGRLKKIIFNLADICIFAGGLLMMLEGVADSLRSRQ